MSPFPQGLYVLEHEPYDEDAPVVVLVHGAMDRSAAFGRVVQRLPDLFVVVYDRRGYARSARAEPAASTLADHANDLLGILEGRPAAVVGHSYGGAVAMLAAHVRPDLITSLGVFESPVPWMPWWPAESAESVGAELLARSDDPGAAAELFVRGQLGDAAWEELPAPTQAERRAEGAVLLADLHSLRKAGAPFDPAELSVPMAVGRGTATAGYQRAAAAALAGATGAELIDIEGGAHGSHTTHPPEFAAFVRRVVELSPGR
jgi:pimeloyl-ACP methyl ester carboxylesterase